MLLYPAVRLETGRDGACQLSTAQRMGREGDNVCGDGEMRCVVCILFCPQLAVLCGQPPDAPRAGGVLGFLFERFAHNNLLCCILVIYM